MWRRISSMLGAAVAAAVFTGAPVSAGVISINVGADSTAATMMRTTDTAGVGDARVTNWNNVIGTATSTASTSVSTGIRTTPDGTNINTPTSLIDNTGALTGAQVSWSYTANATQTTNAVSALSDDQRMFGRYHETQLPTAWTTTSPYSFTVTNIPYAQYDVYVYVTTTSTGGSQSRVGKYEINGQEFFVRPVNDGTTWTKGPWPAYYQQGTDTVAVSYGVSQAAASTQDDGNYAVFSAISGSSFTLDLSAWTTTGTTARGVIAGFQIVQVIPEPASMALLGLGGLTLLVRRRR